MNKVRRRYTFYIFIIVLLMFSPLLWYCSGVDIVEIGNNDYTNDDKSDDNTGNQNDDDGDDENENSHNNNTTENQEQNTNSNNNNDTNQESESDKENDTSENVNDNNNEEINNNRNETNNSIDYNNENENAEEKEDSKENENKPNDEEKDLKENETDANEGSSEKSENEMLPDLLEEEEEEEQKDADKSDEDSSEKTEFDPSKPVLEEYRDYFDEDENITSINLFTEKAYTSNTIKRFSKSKDFYMYLPSDVVDESKDGDWNYVWDGEYQGASTEEPIPYYETTEEEITSDKENLGTEFNKNGISVRFISIDRRIPSDADDKYITELFLGFLSTKQFAEDLGIRKWKFYFNENLDKIFKKKRISHSFVKSGLKHHPTDKKKFNEYYVFTFFSPKQNRLVFLITVFSFTKFVYKKMKLDGVLDSYYENWISFISSFNFR